MVSRHANKFSKNIDLASSRQSFWISKTTLSSGLIKLITKKDTFCDTFYLYCGSIYYPYRNISDKNYFTVMEYLKKMSETEHDSKLFRF